MTTTSTIDATAEQKISQFMPFLKKQAGGDEDLIQEGAMTLPGECVNDVVTTSCECHAEDCWPVGAVHPGSGGHAGAEAGVRSISATAR